MNPFGHTPICPEDIGTELHLLLEMGADQPVQDGAVTVLEALLLKQGFPITASHAVTWAHMGLATN